MSKAIQFKNKAGEKIYPCPYYPVGSVYISVNSTNPGTIFGGTWEQIKDRFLLACGSTYANGKTGGEATHKLTLNEIPSHNHAIYSGWSENSPGRDAYRYQYWGANDLSWKENPNLSTGYRGGDGSHNNMPPYLTVYMWKRVS